MSARREARVRDVAQTTRNAGGVPAVLAVGRCVEVWPTLLPRCLGHRRCAGSAPFDPGGSVQPEWTTRPAWGSSRTVLPGLSSS